MRYDASPDEAGFFNGSGWPAASDGWTAARSGLALFLLLSALPVLSWAFSPEPFDWSNVLQAALLGTGIGVIGWVGPFIRRALAAISPEQLRVTVSGLLITAAFVGMGAILQVGEPGGVRAFLEGWPLWLGLFLPMGFVLAVIGAAEAKGEA